MMKKTYKYRIYANKKTLEKVDYWLYLCRQLYNTALEQRISIYRSNGASIHRYEQNHQLLGLKDSFPEYKDIGAHVLQDVVNRLDKAYQVFFRRVKAKDGKAGFPRFKGRSRYNSFTFPDSSGWKLEDNHLLVKKIGVFKLKLHRPIEGDIKTVTISKDASGKWYVCLSCNNVPEKKLARLSNTVGVDVGIKSYCVDSDGVLTDNPEYFKNQQRLLRIRNRALARRKLRGNRRNKARVMVAKTHEKIARQRNDFLHKLANYYIANYGQIFIEDLQIQNMVRNKHLSKPITDASWGKFFELLTYKAAEAGRIVTKVPPRNTSQICSRCGNIVAKTLAVRVHECPYCGLVLDRDYNAAININAVGQTVQEQTYAVAQSVS